MSVKLRTSSSRALLLSAGPHLTAAKSTIRQTLGAVHYKSMRNAVVAKALRLLTLEGRIMARASTSELRTPQGPDVS